MDREGKRKTRSTSATDGIADEIKNLKTIVEQLALDNKEIKDKLTESIRSNEFMSQKFDEYKKINEEVIEKLDEITKQNKLLMEKNKTLEKQIKMEKEERDKLEERLYSILNPIELEKRCKNLELHGVTENETENCKEVVNEILKAVSPKTVELVNCYRTGFKFKQSGERNTRPILIKFGNQEQRDIIFASRNNLRKIEDKKLYINENLPPYLRMLRGKANWIRKQKGYRYLWMKNANMLLRKEEGSPVIGIKKISDLEKIV